MKLLLSFFAITFLVFASCKNDKTEKKVIETKTEKIAFNSFGDKISPENALPAITAFGEMKGLKVGDTINLKFTSTIKEVCSKKGCWMKLPLVHDVEAMVRFKDYGFFMPLDSDGKEVIVEGKAFVKETSVKELQHYAEDAGKSKEEIAKITESKKEFAFEANGVLMKVK